MGRDTGGITTAYTRRIDVFPCSLALSANFVLTALPQNSSRTRTTCRASHYQVRKSSPRPPPVTRCSRASASRLSNGSAVSEPHLSVSTESASAASWPAARATGTQCLMNRRACGGAAARHHLSAATTAACQSAAAGHLGTVPESQLMLARTNQTVMLMKRPVAGWNMLNGGYNKCTSFRSWLLHSGDRRPLEMNRVERVAPFTKIDDPGGQGPWVVRGEVLCGLPTAGRIFISDLARSQLIACCLQPS